MKTVCLFVLALIASGCSANYWHTRDIQNFSRFGLIGYLVLDQGASADTVYVGESGSNRQVDAIETQNTILQGQSNNEAGYGWQHR